MTTEEIIERIRQLIEDELNEEVDFNWAIAVQDEANDQLSMCLRGNERILSGCIISIIGAANIQGHNLAIIAAYCLAEAYGFKEFRNAQKFADHLMNCTKLYADMQGDKTFS